MSRFISMDLADDWAENKMTVLQQIRNYMHLVPAQAAAKKLADRVVTADGIKAHPTPEDYFAERGQRLDESDLKGQLLSETA